MGMPRELKNMNAYAEGEGYQGSVKVFEEPKVAHKTSDWRPGGSIGDIPVDRGLEAMTATMTFGGQETGLQRLIGSYALLRLVGAYQADDGSAPDAVEVYLGGLFAEFDPGKSEVGSDTEHKYTVKCRTYRRVVNGVEEIKIDLLRGIYVVGGVDRYGATTDIING